MKTAVYDVLGPEGFGTYEVEWENGPRFTRVSRPPRGTLVPGFVDIHFHGGFGIDFMTCEANELAILFDRLAKVGYEKCLLTTVTAPLEEVKLAIAKIPEHDVVAGFHLEGPFISPVFPGAQPKRFIIDPPVIASPWDEVLDDPRLRIITLAPERPHALEFTARMMEQGAIVSIGHTNATYEEARRGFEFGASHATHTFNAMRPFHHREAGTVGYVLHQEGIMAELIYDRHHVSFEAAELLLQVKGADHVVAVSDGTCASGMPNGSQHDMWGQIATVHHGEVRLENGTLAGSAITLADAFQNLYVDFGPEVAIKLCCINPRKALKMTGPPRVWLEFDEELELVARHEVRS
ncbi:MAG TPA: amidohydrolase family protein [Fimbriimonas sp.]|nr:amidohydrolase family protein [Fimbriimonas sp.]